MLRKWMALLMVLALMTGPCLLTAGAETSDGQDPVVLTEDQSGAGVNEDKGDDTPDDGKDSEAHTDDSGNETPGDGPDSDAPDAGKNDETSEDGTGSDAPDAGKNDETSEDGTGSDAPDTGKDNETPEDGTGSDAPDTGKDNETPEDGTGSDTPDTGKDNETPDDSTGSEKPDDGEGENPGGTTECPHSFGDWTVESQGHYRVCGKCGEKEQGAHTPDQGTVTVKPTCLEKGSITYRCTVCGANKIEVLDKTEHTYSYECDAVCDVCTAIREVEHKTNAAWSKDFTGHWHVCRICGEKQDIADHYPGPAATEEKDQICLTCGYILTPKRTHTHNYETKLTYDETGHWYACSGCEEKKDFERHSLQEDCEAGCSLCGYQGTAQHTYQDTWGSDETGHWAICTVCKKPDKVQPHEPGPEATETAAQLCQVCGYELTPMLEPETTVGETTGEEWQSSEQSHWIPGGNGQKLQEAPHTWDNGINRWDGAVVYTCTVCQAERVETDIEVEPQEKGGFSWAIVLLVVLILLFAATAVLLVLMLKKNGGFSGKFLNKEASEEEDSEWDSFDGEELEVE